MYREALLLRLYSLGRFFSASIIISLSNVDIAASNEPEETVPDSSAVWAKILTALIPKVASKLEFFEN
ncbi:hypothetical protein K8R14_02385 [bacterium]|nr:hypothetical protein [bacterium]